MRCATGVEANVQELSHAERDRRPRRKQAVPGRRVPRRPAARHGLRPYALEPKEAAGMAAVTAPEVRCTRGAQDLVLRTLPRAPWQLVAALHHPRTAGSVNVRKT